MGEVLTALYGPARTPPLSQSCCIESAVESGPPLVRAGAAIPQLGNLHEGIRT